VPGTSFSMIIGTGGTGPSLLAFVSAPCKYVRHKVAHSPAGLQLRNMLERAYKWAKIQREVANSMTVTWSEFVPEWKRMLQKYKMKNTHPNPFEEPDPGKNSSRRHIIVN
jgi:hypothetical protein